jgi:hypothetical protein
MKNRMKIFLLSLALIGLIVSTSCSPSKTPTITTNSLLEGTEGQAYSQTLQVHGGTPPYTWFAMATLPPGLQLDPLSGLISGTPLAGWGPAFVSFQVTDHTGMGSFKQLLITVNPTTAVTSSTTSSISLVQTATQEDADARLPTPAGVVVYEGNLNGAGLVPTITLTFSAENDSIYINYRASITTTQGSDRNEIISITDSAGKIRYNQIGPYSYVGDVTLTVQGLPVGITAEYDTPGFVFHISNDARHGQYSFQIIATINGKTYPLPCTITVL